MMIEIIIVIVTMIIDNIDENYDKYDQHSYKYYDFWVKNLLILGPITLWKRARNLGMGKLNWIELKKFYFQK